MGNKNSKSDLTEIELHNLEHLAPNEKRVEKATDDFKTVESAQKLLGSAKFQDRVSKYFDIVFVIGFAALAIILPF